MQPEQPLNFSQAIKQYALLALDLWPALKLALVNLPQASKPPQGSMLPPLNYNNMNQEQFINGIAEGLHYYILNYDVKEDDIEEYLDDILFILNAVEENQNTIRFMSNELIELINEIQENTFDRLYSMRKIHEQNKNKFLPHQTLGQSEQEEESQEDSEQQLEECPEKEEEGEKNEKQLAEDDEKKRMDEELQNDGWNIVRKKAK